MIMRKVLKEDYNRFVELARKNICNTVYPMSVAEGFQQGDIFTDSLEEPTFALFWHVSGFAYLTGKTQEEYLEEIYDLLQDKDGTNPRRLVLELKDEEVAAYFEKKEDVAKNPRYRFRLKEYLENTEESANVKAEIPEGYELREVDGELAEKITGNIIPSLFWSSKEEFLEKGKGYCLVYDGKVAAVAFSAAVSSEQVDIGIETAEDHRKKGLATIVAREMVAYVKSMQKEPVWDCNVSNKGSKATAEKVGFCVIAEHAFFIMK